MSIPRSSAKITPMILTLVQIGIGGAFGSISRFLTGVAAERILGTGFPYGTFIVNMVGSLLMGIAFVLLADSQSVSTKFAPLVLTGFLGGYTTFSAYSLDFWRLFTEGRLEAAMGYALGSVFVAIVSLAVGITVARWGLS